MFARLNPYIAFDGSARAAMEFYRDVFGGNLEISTFGEFGTEGAGSDNVMHAQLEAPNGITLMASDVPPDREHKTGNNISVSLSGDDGNALRGYWDKLSASGTVTMPFETQVWGDDFGMCVDRFGITWMVSVAKGAEAGR